MNNKRYKQKRLINDLLHKMIAQNADKTTKKKRFNFKTKHKIKISTQNKKTQT